MYHENLLNMAELYASAYQTYGRSYEELKGDMIVSALIAPHITTVSRYIAMQQAALIADTIIKPVWVRLAGERMISDALAALAFIKRTEPD